MSRMFVPENLNVDSPNEVETLYKQLAETPLENTATALRKWILCISELDSVLSEVSARRYVAMTCNTKDPEAAKAYEDFVENIDPIQQKYHDLLNKKMIAHPSLNELNDEFGVYFRSVKVSLELFNEKNIPLETEVQKELQAYQKITGSMSVMHNGEEKTLQQMSNLLESNDREIRKEAWEKIQNRRLQDKDKLNEAFDKLFKLRNTIAKNAGCNDFIEYIYKAKNRFDYSPKDCYAFHETIEKLILPLQKKMYESRKKQMNLSVLRPWDVSCDALFRAPLSPYKDGNELIEKCARIFEKLDSRAGAWLRQMQTEKLIDPESRLGKAPGGYQIGFDESRRPFIFMNAAGSDRDIYTLLHESGHSFHQFCMANQPISAYRDIPSEIAEVASMSMELIGASQIQEFYPNSEEAARSRQGVLEDVIWLFPWVACIDSFQHELYKRENHTVKDREEIWLSIMNRYDAGVDYSGYENILANLWQKQLHLFECPFYYIEYGIAELGALQVWNNFRENPKKAFDMLFEAESLGSSRPLPELFNKAGIKFDFSPKTVEPLVQAIWDEYEKTN